MTFYMSTTRTLLYKNTLKVIFGTRLWKRIIFMLVMCFRFVDIMSSSENEFPLPNTGMVCVKFVEIGTVILTKTFLKVVIVFLQMCHYSLSPFKRAWPFI